MAVKKQSYTLEDADIYINGNIIGGVQNVTINRNQENEAKHEAGSHKPREIRDGSLTFDGSIERLDIDRELLNEVLDQENGLNPYFDLIERTKFKDPEKAIKVINGKFSNFSFESALDDDATFDLEFDAMDVLV